MNAAIIKALDHIRECGMKCGITVEPDGATCALGHIALASGAELYYQGRPAYPAASKNEEYRSAALDLWDALPEEAHIALFNGDEMAQKEADIYKYSDDNYDDLDLIEAWFQRAAGIELASDSTNL